MLVHAFCKSLFSLANISLLTSVVLAAETVDNVILLVFRYFVFGMDKFLSQCVVWLERDWELMITIDPSNFL